MNNNVARDLQTREAERSETLQRIITYLENDDRVVAAWVTGSLGRQDTDGLSDIDVKIAVLDEHSDIMNETRQEQARQVGTPLLIQEAPHNAPPSGAYLLVMYEGSCGPIHVDWMWQPQSLARIPAEAHILFDRVGLLPEPPVARPMGQALRDQLTERTVFFWMMVQIAAKKSARGEMWAAIIVLNYVNHAFRQIKWLLGLTTELPFLENRTQDPLPAEPKVLLKQVRLVAKEVEDLTEQIMALGGEVPEQVIPAAYRFFDLTEAMIDERE